MMAVIFLMGLQSTFFGPAKYGILPEMLDEKDLSNGNGIIQMSTFAAIIFGTVAGGVLVQYTIQKVYLSSIAFIGIAAIGTISSYYITRVKPSGSTEGFDWNPARKFFLNIKEVRKDRTLYISMLGIGYFWLIGAIFQIVLLVYGKEFVNASETAISIFLALMAVGIGAGSLCAGKLSGGKIELGLVPLGAAGIGLFTLDLAYAYESASRVGIDLFLVGFFAGFFIIPLNTVVQHRSARDSKGKMVATSNIINFIGIFGASFVTWLITDLMGISSADSFVIVASATFAAAALITWLLPNAFVRLLLWLMTHSIYRVKISGGNHFPRHGPGLLTGILESSVDHLLIAASVGRPIKFFIGQSNNEFRPVSLFLKLMKADIFRNTDEPGVLASSLKEASEYLQNGKVVCILEESNSAASGFRNDLERIANGMNAPIIPVGVENIVGDKGFAENYNIKTRMYLPALNKIGVTFGVN